MTIQKKSLISTLNTTKKAIVASTPGTGVSTSEVRDEHEPDEPEPHDQPKEIFDQNQSHHQESYRRQRSTNQSRDA